MRAAVPVAGRRVRERVGSDGPERRREGPGALVLPEVDDEVLVVFEQADFRRPYVLGGLYNGVDQPSARASRSSTAGARSTAGPGCRGRAPRRPADEDGDRGVPRRGRPGPVSPARRDEDEGDGPPDGSVLIRGAGDHAGRGERPARAQGRQVTISQRHPGRPSTGRGTGRRHGSQLDLAGKATASPTAALVKIN